MAINTFTYKDLMKAWLYMCSTEVIRKVRIYIEEAEKWELTNEQWFLDFEDELNKLSIKDHNIKT